MNFKRLIITVLAFLFVLISIEYGIVGRANLLANKANEKASKLETSLETLIEKITEENLKLKALNSEYDKALGNIAQENNVVGMSVIVFKDEKILNSYYYGYADKEDNIEVNENTKYRIASISKVISAIGLMRLYDEGLFDLDDKIDDVLNINAYGDVTFKQLLTHTSGLYDSSVYALAQAGQHLSLEYLVSNSFSNYAPGQNYEYSNFAAGTVGGIIERLTNEYFIDYMRELFESLDIDAAYTADAIEDFDSIAKLYEGGEITDPKTWHETREFIKDYGLGNNCLSAAGDLIISAKDLAKFAMALCNEGIYNGTQIISKEATALMLKDNFDYYDWSGTYKYTEGLFCHNFKTLVEGREIHGHTGAAYGVYTAMYFDPTDNTGVIILDNGASRIENEEGYVSLLYDVVQETYSLYFN